MADRAQCEEKVRWVATAIHDEDELRLRARSAASQLGPDAIQTLVGLFHSEHSPPAEIADQFPRLGSWISARQFAIFEIFYFFREAALPVLRAVAFGEYDWTQGNAVEVLVRLAAEGVERQEIVADIRREFPDFRYEAQLYSVGPLLHHAAHDPAVANVLRELEDLPAWQVAAQELRDAGRG